MIKDDSCAPTLPQNISNLSFANRFYSIVPNMPTSDLNASNGDQDSASVASNSTEPSSKKQRSISKQEAKELAAILKKKAELHMQFQHVLKSLVQKPTLFQQPDFRTSVNLSL
jgi:hypothetical protein